MRKVIGLLLAAALIGGGGWLVLNHYQVQGLDGVRLIPRSGEVVGAEVTPNLPVDRSGDSIRVASFNIQVFGQTKLDKPHVMAQLVEIVRRFDVVAIQEIRSRSQDVLPRFIELINQDGRHYDYVIGPREGRSSSKEQYAFIYDRASLDVDHAGVYAVGDPDDLLHRPPLVALFRVRGPPPEEAFTFTLVNVHTDPDEAGDEVNLLDDVYRLVRADGRGEDDIILLGDFNADSRNLGQLNGIPGLQPAVVDLATNTRGTQQYDNLLIHERATVEFTGRSGVMDFLQELNLTLEQALEVSDHLPVWAEFRLREGARR